MDHKDYMRRALELAAQAAAEGDVPVGCVVVWEGRVVGRGRNRREEDKDAFVIVGEAGQITGEGFRSMHSDDKPVKELLKELRQGGKDKE